MKGSLCSLNRIFSEEPPKGINYEVNDPHTAVCIHISPKFCSYYSRMQRHGFRTAVMFRKVSIQMYSMNRVPQLRLTVNSHIPETLFKEEVA